MYNSFTQKHSGSTTYLGGRRRRHWLYIVWGPALHRLSLFLLYSYLKLWEWVIYLQNTSWWHSTALATYFSHSESSLVQLLHSPIGRCRMAGYPDEQECRQPLVPDSAPAPPLRDSANTGMNLMNNQYKNLNCCPFITWSSSVSCWQKKTVLSHSCPVQTQINARSLSKSR